MVVCQTFNEPFITLELTSHIRITVINENPERIITSDDTIEDGSCIIVKLMIIHVNFVVTVLPWRKARNIYMKSGTNIITVEIAYGRVILIAINSAEGVCRISVQQFLKLHGL